MRRNLRLVHVAQWRFVWWFGLASLLGGALAVGLFNFLAHRKIETVLYAMRLPQASTGDLLRTEMLYADLAALIFIAAAFFWAANWLLTRLDRPLSRMTQEIRRVAAGDLRRNSDLMLPSEECGELAAELCGLREELHRRCHRLQTASAALGRLKATDLSMLPELRQKLGLQIGELKAAIGDLKL
jgi:methyl-accepting chemotaxis protein